jgi:C4-dicarboxylate transporter DctM subunit
MPVIILGGIWSGYFTPTEAAAVAAAYGLFVSMVIYRDLKPRDLPALFLKSFTTSAVVMVVIGATSCLAWLITVEQVPVQIADLVTHYATSPWMFLLLVNIAMLVLGCFIEPVPALILAAPLLVPLSVAFKIEPVHLGLIMTCNLAIGLYTPPVGGTLMVGQRLAGVTMGEVLPPLMRMMAISIAILMVITYVPAISMSLVHALR